MALPQLAYIFPVDASSFLTLPANDKLQRRRSSFLMDAASVPPWRSCSFGLKAPEYDDIRRAMTLPPRIIDLLPRKARPRARQQSHHLTAIFSTSPKRRQCASLLPHMITTLTPKREMIKRRLIFSAYFFNSSIFPSFRDDTIIFTLVLRSTVYFSRHASVCAQRGRDMPSSRACQARKMYSAPGAHHDEAVAVQARRLLSGHHFQNRPRP